MTKVPAEARRHRMVVRRSVSSRAASHRLFACCEETDTPFMIFWNTDTTSGSRFGVLGRPAEVIEEILNHVTDGRDDPQTVEAAATVRVMVGLSDDVIDGIRLIRLQLDYVTLKFRYLRPPVPSAALRPPNP